MPLEISGPGEPTAAATDLNAHFVSVPLECLTMSAPLLHRAVPLLRLCLRHHRPAAPLFTLPFFSSKESSRSDETVSHADKNATILSSKDPANHSRWDDPDFQKWKKREEDILRDIEPITSLTKEILHSDRYMDGERLTAEDEKAVVEKLLVYHPHSEDKIGCGLDCIMVDRHPQFQNSRCLFVVRTDGGWIDFSYQKCLRAYVRVKYPAHADRFIREHFKRSS